MTLSLDEIMVLPEAAKAKPTEETKEPFIREYTHDVFTLTNLKQSRFNEIHDTVIKLLDSIPTIVLAGGALRDGVWDGYYGDANDYDMFFLHNPTNNDIEQAKALLVEAGFAQSFACPAGELFSYIYPVDDGVFHKIQLITKRRYHDPQELIETFDVSVCMWALHRGVLYTTKRAISDYKKRRVSINNIVAPVASINRLAKYQRYGYFIGNAAKELADWIGNLRPQEYAQLDTELYID